MVGVAGKGVVVGVHQRAVGFEQAHPIAAVAQQQTCLTAVEHDPFAGRQRDGGKRERLRPHVRFIIQRVPAQVDRDRAVVDDLDEFIVGVDEPVVVPVASGAGQEFVDGNEGRRGRRWGCLGGCCFRRGCWGD